MTSLSRELVFLILQFLDEEKFKETVHKLEQESGFFFNMRHFEELVTNGDWDEVEKYLSGFTKVDDNRYSMKIFFEIRKQKYLEALDRPDRAKAVDILAKDLKVFSAFNEELFKEITHLLTLENFRQNEQLSKYGDTKSARGIMLSELKKLIEGNPLFREKLHFPSLKNSRLRTLINQSLNWQHQLCKNPRSNPDIKTLFVDHTCGPPNDARVSSPVTNPLMGAAVAKPGSFPLGAHGPFQTAPAALPTPVAGWMANPSPGPHPTASAGPIGLGAPNAAAAALLKRPRTPPNNGMAIDYQTADSEHALKRSRPFGVSNEVNHMHVNIAPAGFTNQSHGQSSYSSDDLPRNVIMNLPQGSSAKSLDFHPLQPVLLLVGTNTGDSMIWELVTGKKVALAKFKVWDREKYSTQLQTSLLNDQTVSINRVMWSPDGKLFGVAYSKHLVHLYSYNCTGELINPLEIEAHAGSVNDLAFSYPTKQLCVVTCGEDKLIKVWDAATGNKQFTFEGHEAPVYSVCPHYKENIQFIFSTSTDGKIKAWLYDDAGPRVDYVAPGRSSTSMAYSADGTRLFSCGTTKEGESFLVEWNESEGKVKRQYHGLGKRSAGVVQFDTTRNRFLAVGDDFVVKFWDMDSNNPLTNIDAEGGLSASPCIRFNKDGNLLAVSTNDNGVKVVANSDGFRLLRNVESNPFDPSKVVSASASASVVKASPQLVNFPPGTTSVSAPMGDRNGLVAAAGSGGVNADNRSLVDVRPRVEGSVDKPKAWKLPEINEPSQCRALRLADNNISTNSISRLIYTNSGFGILALASNAVHKLWKWQRTDRGKATASIVPQLWQPASGILMTNDLTDTNLEEPASCFALSKNDSYVMSASGGKISLFNMMTFKTMTTFMPPPPAATFLAFHPQDNNIIAIGMEDSSVQIYNVRVDEVKIKLDGHQKRITGLAFSNALNILVSSGADAQVCVWSMDEWNKITSKYLQKLGSSPSCCSETRVEFHKDEIHLLAVHSSQIAIYEAPKLECLKQWVPQERGRITDAAYSCDSESIFVSFEDGSVSVLSASSLRLKCRINPAAYLLSPNPNPNPNPSSRRVYPSVIAAHPSEASQFALGLSDGGVCVLEPPETQAHWGLTPPPPPPENNAAAAAAAGTANASTTDQPQR